MDPLPAFLLIFVCLATVLTFGFWLGWTAKGSDVRKPVKIPDDRRRTMVTSDAFEELDRPDSRIGRAVVRGRRVRRK